MLSLDSQERAANVERLLQEGRDLYEAGMADHAVAAWTEVLHIQPDEPRALEYLRSAGVTPDERVTEAIEVVAAKRDAGGRWPLETRYPGVMPVEVDDGEGRPSRWNTLRALRVLRWYEGARP